jgi:hypothetical protein
MVPVTHQTIKLSKGKHTSPDEGACVMELSSMLAGEPFSDHPRSVCPVIAAVLRRYNDALDDWRRQDLYAYAARVVGSRGSMRLERVRTEYLRRWLSERSPGRRHRWLRAGYLLGVAEPSVDVLAERVVRKISRHDERTHLMMLELVDDLLALDPREQSAMPPVPTPRATGPGTTEPERSREPSYPSPRAR